PADGADHGVRRDSSPVQTGEAEEDASPGRVRLRFSRFAFPTGPGGPEAPPEDRGAEPPEAEAAGDRSHGAPPAAGGGGSARGRDGARAPGGIRGGVRRAARGA